MADHDSFLLSLPFEIRELVLEHLIPGGRSLEHPSTEGPHSMRARKTDDLFISPERTWCKLANSSFENGKFVLSSSGNFQSAIALMQTCHRMHAEVSRFLNPRLVWDLKMRNYPQFTFPTGTLNIRHFRLDAFSPYDSVLRDTRQSTQSLPEPHRSSFHQEFYFLCEELAKLAGESSQLESGTAGRAGLPVSWRSDNQIQRDLSVQIDVRMVTEIDLIHMMDALGALKTVVQELRVGALCFSSGFTNGRLKASNRAYQRLGEIFGDNVRWVFPNRRMQYKD